MAQPVAGASFVPPVVTYVFAAVFFAALLGGVLYLTYVGLTDDAHSRSGDPRVETEA